MRALLRARHDLTDDVVDAMVAGGHSVVAGVDEVGRGALAGPVTAAAVVLPGGLKIRGVRDSKRLSRLQRERLVTHIKQLALCIGIGWAAPIEIDQHGLTEAVRRAALRALGQLNADCRAVVLDGKHNYLPSSYHCRTIVGGDDRVLSVAAASIVAKVARDAYMRRHHLRYPDYNFDHNVGYGTLAHRLALRAGTSPLHRQLFLRSKTTA